jgi:anthranilate phosphoribosyltransferase
MVVCGEDGVDEISIAGRTRVIEVRDGGTAESCVDPTDLGLERASLEAIAGGSPEDNAAVVRAVLGGEASPARDVIALNAAATILVAGEAQDLEAGLSAASASLDGGAAADVLENLRALTAELAAE